MCVRNTHGFGNSWRNQTTLTFSSTVCYTVCTCTCTWSIVLLLMYTQYLMEYLAAIGSVMESLHIHLSFSFTHTQNRELQIMRRLDHCNIIRLQYFFYSQGDKVVKVHVLLCLLLLSLVCSLIPQFAAVNTNFDAVGICTWQEVASLCMADKPNRDMFTARCTTLLSVKWLLRAYINQLCLSPFVGFDFISWPIESWEVGVVSHILLAADFDDSRCFSYQSIPALLYITSPV